MGGITIHPVSDLASLLSLEQVKPDAYLGAGPVLGWGRIYGGQVVAQALRAAGLTVPDGLLPQSLHAYFVQAGDERLPVLYEVERVRDSGSFATRQVVAYQSQGAVLNLIASFHRPEASIDVQAVSAPSDAPDPDTMPAEDTDLLLDRRSVSRVTEPEPYELGWMRVPETLGADPMLQACAFAYCSDEFPLGTALSVHPVVPDWSRVFTASLDHALWFHRPLRADDWLLYELRAGGVSDGRGLTFARVFDRDGTHVASMTQEALVRGRR
jgi:acyl-CoA thioesterase-2